MLRALKISFTFDAKRELIEFLLCIFELVSLYYNTNINFPYQTILGFIPLVMYGTYLLLLVIIKLKY